MKLNLCAKWAQVFAMTSPTPISNRTHTTKYSKKRVFKTILRKLMKTGWNLFLKFWKIGKYKKCRTLKILLIMQFLCLVLIEKEQILRTSITISKENMAKLMIFPTQKMLKRVENSLTFSSCLKIKNQLKKQSMTAVKPIF